MGFKGWGRVDKRVPVNALKTRLIAYLGQVREGTTLTVTDRDRAVARLIPVIEDPIQSELYRRVEEGRVVWEGGRPFGLPDSQAPRVRRDVVTVRVDVEMPS